MLPTARKRLAASKTRAKMRHDASSSGRRRRRFRFSAAIRCRPVVSQGGRSRLSLGYVDRQPRRLLSDRCAGGTDQPQIWRVGGAEALLITGVLGGFTTFSAFSLDALVLFERGETVAALLYIASSVVVPWLPSSAALRLYGHSPDSQRGDTRCQKAANADSGFHFGLKCSKATSKGAAFALRSSKEQVWPGLST